jgi:hypothetical protein
MPRDRFSVRRVSGAAVSKQKLSIFAVPCQRAASWTAPAPTFWACGSTTGLCDGAVAVCTALASRDARAGLGVEESTSGAELSAGTDDHDLDRGRRTRPGSWTGTCRWIPRSCGMINMARARRDPGRPRAATRGLAGITRNSFLAGLTARSRDRPLPRADHQGGTSRSTARAGRSQSCSPPGRSTTPRCSRWWWRRSTWPGSAHVGRAPARPP